MAIVALVTMLPNEVGAAITDLALKESYYVQLLYVEIDAEDTYVPN